ncbi:MAG: extensin family protein [Paracoccaceae bacterium]
MSEHGRGKAIDVSGYTLRDGTQITVLRDWGAGRNGRALREMHRAACGPFGTVLGPQADRFHLDHFHFDTARHRGGPYCR